MGTNRRGHSAYWAPSDLQWAPWAVTAEGSREGCIKVLIEATSTQGIESHTQAAVVNYGHGSDLWRDQTVLQHVEAHGLPGRVPLSRVTQVYKWVSLADVRSLQFQKLWSKESTVLTASYGSSEAKFFGDLLPSTVKTDKVSH